MTHSSIPHALVPDNAARRQWVAARKAARRREDFCSALDCLGDTISDIAETVRLLADGEKPFDEAAEEMAQQFVIVRAELHELWRLVDEDAP